MPQRIGQKSWRKSQLRIKKKERRANWTIAGAALVSAASIPAAAFILVQFQTSGSAWWLIGLVVVLIVFAIAVFALNLAMDDKRSIQRTREFVDARILQPLQRVGDEEEEEK